MTMYAIRCQSSPGRVSAARRRARLLVNSLERRILPATFTVTNTLDSGPGSLRQAVLDANASTDPLDIVDAKGVSGTISLGSTIDITGPTELDGAGADKLTVSGGGKVLIFDATTSSKAGVTFDGWNLSDGNGSIVAYPASVTIRHCIIGHDTNTGTGDVGAIYSHNAASLTIEDSTITSNSNAGDGAITLFVTNSMTVRRSVITDNIGKYTGGIYGYLCKSLLIDSSTIANNSGSAAVDFYSYTTSANLITNSTIYGNSTTYGAVQASGTAQLTLQNCTVTNNTGVHVGGIYAGSVNLTSTIVSGNRLPSSVTNVGVTVPLEPQPPTPSFPDVKGNIVGNHNLIGVVSGSIMGVGNLSGTTAMPLDAKLTPLGNYGGSTPTCAPRPNSAAIDAGDNSAGFSFDQRGFPRVTGAATDIGAFETDPAPVAIPPLLSDVTAAGGTTFILSVQYVDAIGSKAINTATLATGNIVIHGPGGFAAVPTYVGIAATSNSWQAVYRFTPPGGSWTADDNGLYSVEVVPNQIYDLDTPTPHSVLPGPLGTWRVRIPRNFVVDSVSDEDDGNISPGHLSLREAIRLANEQSPSAATISFSPSVFGTQKTITLDPALGGLEIKAAVPIIGPGVNLLTISGSGAGYALEINLRTATTQMDISGLTFAKATYTSADIIAGQVTFHNCNFTGSQQAIDVEGTSNLTLDGCDVTDNNIGIFTSGYYAGGLLVVVRQSTFERNEQGIFGYSPEAITVDQSLFANNLSPDGNGAAISAGNGNVLIQNSTFAGNRAVQGGAIYMSQGNLQIVNSTLTDNSAASNGGAIYFGNGIQQNPVPTIRLTNSIVAGNHSIKGSDVFCFPGRIAADHSIIGVVNDGNFAVIGTGNIWGTLANPRNPSLFPLSSNGGPTRSMAPKPGSPEINAGSRTSNLSVDQRGFPRIVGSAVDIGAVEIGPGPVASASAPDVPSATGAAFSITVNYCDIIGGGINQNTLSTGNISVIGPGGFTATPTFVSAAPNGSTVTAIYSFTPSGPWTTGQDGTYVISVAANSVFDADTPTPHSVFGGQIGQFDVIIPRHFVVNSILDVDDGNNGPGNLTLREAVRLANSGPAGTQDVITFDPVVFGVPRVITFDPTLYYVNPSDAVDIQGPGPSLLTINGGDVFVAGIITGTDVRISGFTFTGSTSIGDYYSTVIVKNCVFDGTGASSPMGPAVSDAYPSASLTLEDCTIRNYIGYQSAISCGGSLTIRRCAISGNSNSDRGGGVYAGGPSTIIEDSTISGNTAGAADEANVQGGGIFAGYSNGNNPSTGTLLIRNCTISNNRLIGAGNGIKGGGVFSYEGQTVIENSTIAYNAAPVGGGVAYGFNGGVAPGVVTAKSTIIAGNSGGDVAGLGSFSSNNLYNMSAAAAGIGKLGNYGGTMQTIPLLPGSPAINKGINPDNLTTDERGYLRSYDSAPDIGAFELQPPRVLSVVINDGSAQRSRVTSVTVNFDSTVAIGPGAFQLQRQSDGKLVSVFPDFFIGGPTTSVSLSFSGPLTEFGSLQDGRYTLTVFGNQVSNFVGGLDGKGKGTSGSDYVLASSGMAGIFRLFGDSDGDGAVAANDLLQFRQYFGGENAIFDFDGDGYISANDFLQFRLRFGGSI
jgi:hypothetical protein